MNKKQILSISFLTIVLFFLVATIWFRNGFLIAAGESGIPFYHTSFLVSLLSSSWAPPALGNPTSSTVVGLPLYFFINSLNIIFSNSFTQQLSFSLLFIFPFFTFIIAYKKYPFSVRLFAGLFYLFNIGALVFIWNRMQYPYIFFYSFLPLGFFIFENGIKKRKIFSIVCLNLAFFVFSMAQILPLLELFWLLLLSYVVYYGIINWRKKNQVFGSWIYFFSSIVVWLVFNAWWLLQFLDVLYSSTYISSVAYSSSGDLSTLQTLSNSLGNMSYLFRLMHIDFFQSINTIWGNWYSSSLFILVGYLVPLLVFTNLLLKQINRNIQKNVYFFVALSLITLFFQKGTNAPFGGIATFLFVHIRFLEAFRNPVEKLGLVVPFLFAIPFGIAITHLYEILRRKGRSLAYLLIPLLLFVTCIVLVFPMWNGWVFSGTSTPNNVLSIRDYVEVPLFYKDANNWLNKDRNDVRALALPMSGEGITYKWLYGYSGVEMSNGLFDKPFVSLSTSIQYLPSIANQIQKSLLQTPAQFPVLLKFLNVKYVMVRSDIDYKERGMTNPDEINSFLSTASGNLIPGLTYAKTFGKLVFYKNTNPISKIYAPENLTLADADINFSDIFQTTNLTGNDAIANTTNSPVQNSFIENNAENIILKPTSIFNYSNYPDVTLDTAKQQLTSPRYLPGSFSYVLIRLKEKFQASFTSDTNTQLFTDLTLTSKRLSELNALISLHKEKYITQALSDYISSLNTLNTFVSGPGNSVMKNNIYFFRQQLLGQRLILEDLAKDGTNISMFHQALDTLQEVSLTNGVYAEYKPIQFPQENNIDREIYDFTVEKSGNYTILLEADTSKEPYTEGNLVPLQIDNHIVNVPVHGNNNWINLGDAPLTPGLHEVQVPYTNTIVTSGNSFSLMGTMKNTVTKTITLNNLDTSATYSLSLDYWIEKGDSVLVNFRSNVDQREDNKDIPFSHTQITDDIYNHSFQNKTVTFTPPANAKELSIEFVAKPYNSCKESNPTVLGTYQCAHSKSYMEAFNRPTEISIKNLQVKKVSSQPMLLRMTQQNIPSFTPPTITYTMINPAQYTIHISHATKPFFLVFSESYHPLWQLQFADTKQIVSQKDHFLTNSYANMWYINRRGSYDFHLNFTAEYFYTIGKWISGIAIVVSIIWLLILGIKKWKAHIWK